MSSRRESTARSPHNNAGRTAVSVTSIFGEADDFEAALRKDGVRNLLLTRGDRFQARLTQITLQHLRLTVAEEELPRIAFVTVPAGKALVALPIGKRSSLVLGGIEIQAGEIATLLSGQQAHMRIDRPCRWAVVLMPSQDLFEYVGALREGGFEPLPAARQRPAPVIIRNLRHLLVAVVRFARGRPQLLINCDAAHGLEQQLLDALCVCLSTEPIETETPAAFRNRSVVVRFEKSLEADPLIRIDEISATLGVSDRMLRACSMTHLGVVPSKYIRLRRMQLIRQLLRSEDPTTASIPEVAQRYGFKDFGRFARVYHSLYGEAPIGRGGH